MERFVSGYCRVLDGSRTVLLEDDEADCAYPGCVYAAGCPIAVELHRICSEARDEK